jgi:TolB protein
MDKTRVKHSTQKFILIAFLAILAVSFLYGCVTLPVEQITILSGNEFGPATFSPDGKEIVFSLGTKSRVFFEGTKRSSHLYKVRIDGTGLVALTKGDVFDFDPAYSPDGGQILFSSKSDGQSRICVMKSDGSELISLTSGTSLDYSPIFSSDGQKVYFLRAKWFGHYSPIAMPNWHDIDIYSINIDGSDLKRITSNHYYGIANLSAHPDGNTLLARITALNSEYSIWMIPIDDPMKATPVQPDLDAYKTKVPLFSLKSIDYSKLYDPLYSPDGTSLLFTWEGHYKSTYANIYVMDLKTKKTQRATNTERVIYHYPRFSNDGQRIVFSATASVKNPGLFGTTREEPSLWIINTDGSGLKHIDLDSTNADRTVTLERPAQYYYSPPMR